MTGPVLVLASPRLSAMVGSALPPDARWVGDADTFVAALHAAPASAIALIDPFSARGRVTWEARRILTEAGVVPVVAVVDLSPGSVPHVRELLDQGLADVVDLGMERTADAAWPRVRAATARPLKRRIEKGLPEWISQDGLTLVRAVAEGVVRGGTADDLGGRFGVEERTFAGWCRKEGLPAPRRLQAWIRLLLALALLERPERSVLAAARAAGYANESSMRRAFRSMLGEDAGRAPRTCSFDGALRMLADELGAMRTPPPTRFRRAIIPG